MEKNNRITALVILTSLLTNPDGKMTESEMAIETRLTEIESGTFAKDLAHCSPHFDHPRILCALKENFENPNAAHAHHSFHKLHTIMNSKEEKFDKGVKIMNLYIEKGQRSYAFSNLVITSLAKLFYSPRSDIKEQRRFAEWVSTITTNIHLPARKV